MRRSFVPKKRETKIYKENEIDIIKCLPSEIYLFFSWIEFLRKYSFWQQSQKI